jgi:hypothetical protein
MSIQTDDPKREFINMLNHDMKLWDMAEESPGANPGEITKTLRGIPWGIGELEVTLSGITSADARRSAIATFADYVRGGIDERINDEAVEARAAQAAALAREDTGDIPVDVGGNTGSGEVATRTGEVQEAPREGAVQTLGVPPRGDADPAARLLELRGYIDDTEGLVAEARAGIAAARKEIKALNAYMEVLNETTDPDAGVEA